MYYFYFTKFSACCIHVCNVSEEGNETCRVILLFEEKPDT